jgi:hypothetical protein
MLVLFIYICKCFIEPLSWRVVCLVSYHTRYLPDNKMTPEFAEFRGMKKRTRGTYLFILMNYFDEHAEELQILN